MSPLPTVTFRGVPEPDPGPIPAAREELLRARDFGEIAFADAPRDRTLLPDLLAAADRIRGASTGLDVFADAHAWESVAALLAVTGAPRPDPDEARPAHLFLEKGRGDPDPAVMDEWATVRDRLAAEDGHRWRDRVGVVTDPARGALFEEAVRTGVSLFPWPVRGAGRESILSAVGLLPAACVGVDVTRLLDDAREAQEHADRADFAQNPAWRLAAALASADGWAAPVAGPERLTPLADWFGGLLRSFSLAEPVPGGLPIRLEPRDPGAPGVAVSGGSPGALIQTLLNGAALHGISVRGVDKRVRP